jgi:formylglycine-generating enzyme required for sulfatase activity
MHRKIRALDILLVSPEATRKLKGRRTARALHTSWAGANAFCEALEIDGIAGWRLPTAGEFRTLGTSNMLGRRIYWSATEGDAFGTDRVVWNNLKKRMAPAPSTWKGGRVLCVRFQHPERAVAG